MIVRRNRPKQEPVRRIVKRATPAPPPRAIVRRSASLGVHTGQAARRRGWGIPTFGVPALLAWRPGWRFYTLACLLAVFGLLGAGGYWAVTSPYFKVRSVEVEGNSVIPAEIIVEQLGLDGKSMFTLELDAAQTTLQAMPLVRSVNVERRWPDTIHVTVVERQPWGTWEQDGVAYTIDSEGVVLGLLTPPAGSPVIRSSQQGTRQQGDRVDYQAVDAATALYAELPRVIGTSVAEIAYEPELGLVVRTGDGERAIFGDSSAIEYKLAVWAALAESARDRHFNYTTIDLRFGNRPVLQ